MDETQSAAAMTHWCHMCNQMVDPIIESDTIKCPLCQSGFVEQMGPTSTENNQISDDYLFGTGEQTGPHSDRALSTWAPVLLNMMSNPRRRRRRRLVFDYEDNENDDIFGGVDDGGNELNRELQSFIRTRRRNSGSVLQFLQGIRTGTVSENETGFPERDMTEIRERNRVILINRLNQTIILQGGNFRNGGSLGDYFDGSGTDLLLQHLAENDPNRYGTPPAEKGAVEKMPTVKVMENIKCSVCLDDLSMGTEAKEMPCKHKFHSDCIFPWLELHSSCPVCRYQLPSDGCKTDNNNNSDNINDNVVNSHYDDNSSGGSSGNRDNIVGERDRRSENRRGFSVPLPWPFNNLFNASGNRGSSSPSSNNVMGNASSRGEN